MMLKEGDYALTIGNSAIGYDMQEWNARHNSKVFIYKVGPETLAGLPVYKVLFEDGYKSQCTSGLLRPYYDGNQKSSWETLRGIYQPKLNHDKVNS